MSSYFLTGATGAVGSAVLARLLAEPQVRVAALVRGTADRPAPTRLDEILSGLGLCGPSARADGRLSVLQGDAESPRFGLSSAEYERLRADCQQIIHCAGAVRMNLPLEAARRSASDSLRNVLSLAREAAPKKVEIVSTVGVGGRDHRLLRETWVGTSHRFHNTYEQAKAGAEQLARAAASEGLPICVHRPSMVVGHSQTGHTLQFQVFYFLVEFLSGRRTRGLFPALGAATLDIVPVDFVAEAIVRSSLSSRTAGRILHLCAGPRDAIPLKQLQVIIRDAFTARGHRLPRAFHVPAKVFGSAVRALRLVADARTRSALDTLPVFLEYLETNQAFDNTLTAGWLAEERLAMPRAEEYLDAILSYYLQRKT